MQLKRGLILNISVFSMNSGYIMVGQQCWYCTSILSEMNLLRKDFDFGPSFIPQSAKGTPGKVCQLPHLIRRAEMSQKFHLYPQSMKLFWKLPMKKADYRRPCCRETPSINIRFFWKKNQKTATETPSVSNLTP